MPGTVSEVSATLVASTIAARCDDPVDGLEDPVLLGGRQPGVQRQDVGLGPALERVGGVADLPLAGEEDEDVARALALELADRVGDGLDLVAVLVAVARLGIVDRAVADLDRVGAAGDLDDRGGLPGCAGP